MSTPRRYIDPGPPNSPFSIAYGEPLLTMAAATTPPPNELPEDYQDSPEYPTPRVDAPTNHPYFQEKPIKRLIDNKTCPICGAIYRYRTPHYKKHHPEALRVEQEAEAEARAAQPDVASDSAKKRTRKPARLSAASSNNDADGGFNDNGASLEATHANGDDSIMEGHSEHDASPRNNAGPPENNSTFCDPCGRRIPRVKWVAHQRAHTVSSSVLAKFYATDANGTPLAGIHDDEEPEAMDEVEQPMSGGSARRVVRGGTGGSWRQTAARHERVASDHSVVVINNEPAVSERAESSTRGGLRRVASWERLLEAIREAPELSKAQKRDLVYKVFEERALNPSSVRRQATPSAWAAGVEGEGEGGRKRSASEMLDDDENGSVLE
jgi:hypothetical protein